MKSHTVEEKFIMRLYELVSGQEEPDYRVSRYDVGRSIGFSPKLVDTITKEMVRMNFVRTDGSELIYITDNGIRLAKQLLEE
jgi:Mn-dependent DtxR family transcriptional regulator